MPGIRWVVGRDMIRRDRIRCLLGAKNVSVDTVTKETVGITMVNIVMSVNNLSTKKATFNFLCTTHTVPLVLQPYNTQGN